MALVAGVAQHEPDAESVLEQLEGLLVVPVEQLGLAESGLGHRLEADPPDRIDDLHGSLCRGSRG